MMEAQPEDVEGPQAREHRQLLEAEMAGKFDSLPGPHLDISPELISVL